MSMTLHDQVQRFLIQHAEAQDWGGNVQDARDADTSPAFKQVVLAAYEEMKPTQEKWSV